MHKRQIKPQHLKDIDFRKRELRQLEAIEDFKLWYKELYSRPYSERLQGQLTMLSAVLWYLVPAGEYKKLVTNKQNLATTPEEVQEQLVADLKWIV